MDIDSALKVADGEDIRNRCHVNSNEDGDRFVGVKADSDKAMVYFQAISFRRLIRKSERT